MISNDKLSYFNINSIKPQGWLLNQLKIQANGLTGNLQKFWPDIKDSSWIGGNCEGWERVPYWLDGFVPLAYLLDDAEMKETAKFYIDYIIKQQKEDGWICPCKDEERNHYDLWALMLILKVLIEYYEVSKDERVPDVVYKALNNFYYYIDGHSLFDWGMMRWFECLLSVYWLYDRVHEDWLLDLVAKLRMQGIDYHYLYENWIFEKPVEMTRWTLLGHVVNNAMLIKAGALMYKYSGDENDLHYIEKALGTLMKYHSMPTGMFSGDECLAGDESIRGTELCAVVETMFSLETHIACTGDYSYFDLLEKIAFNALPATISPDMWSHQYLQQTNQVFAKSIDIQVFNTTRQESIMFGLEPNFGCCTANMHQGWPKFARSSFAKSSDSLYVLSYIPNKLVSEIDGIPFEIEVVSEYPFKNCAEVVVKSEKELPLKLKLRIPKWSTSTEIICNGKQTVENSADVFEIKESVAGELRIKIVFNPDVKITERPYNMYCIERGPLLYSLKLDEKWTQINKDVPGREYPHCDYEVTPLSEWNYGISDTDIAFEEHGVGDCPFSPEGAPVTAYVKCKKIKWEIENGFPQAKLDKIEVLSDEEKKTFIPYGCTNIRMTEMPILFDKKQLNTD